MKPQVLEFLKRDIPELENTIHRIDAEVESLLAEREAAQFKLSMIRSQLGGAARSKQEDEDGTETETEFELAANVHAPYAAVHSSVRGLGLRDAIRTVLRDSGRALATAEVKDQLLRRGYRYDGTLDINVRVGNE